VIEKASASKLTFVYFDAGGGHRSTANALSCAIREQRRPWEVSLLHFQELLDSIDFVRKLAGIRMQDVYNLMLKKGWTLGTAQMLPVLHGMIRVYHRSIVQLLEKHWRESQPDLVVSLIPHFNRQLAESVRRALPGVPFVTLLTDLADYPPHFWIERESEYLICGTERAAAQALAMGHSPDHVLRISGMVVNPVFYQQLFVDRYEARKSLGLDPKLRTGLVMFGGEGSAVMARIAERLDSTPNLQLIFVCGKNKKVAAELRGMRFQIPVFIEGFTTQVRHYMRLSDFFIGKPGPGSISEALTMGLPVIVQCNRWTLPQERFNARWVIEKEVGMVVKDLRHVRGAVMKLLAPNTFARYRASAAALRNRAVFEVPEILDQILKNSVAQPSVVSNETALCRQLILPAERCEMKT
jgi:Glycosyltransferase family 28 C-terminal domain/Monogalactosyldiacylglycerol (MGDG) synthase